MRNKALLFAAAAVLAVLPAVAEAAPNGPALQGIAAPHAMNVQYYAYRGDWDYGPRRHYRGGLFDIPGEIIAGTAGIAEDALEGTVNDAPYRGDATAACERRFRSFDPATGMYTTYAGEQVLCPYLGE